MNATARPTNGADEEPAWVTEFHALTDLRDEPDPEDLAFDDERLAALAAGAAETRRRLAEPPPPLSPDGQDVALELHRLDAERAATVAAIGAAVGGLPGWSDFDPAAGDVADPPAFPEPEDRGTATLSPLGEVEYIEDLIRPGRIVVWAAEEGAGKSYAVGGELAVRVAIAGGSFAGTWPILRTGPVLYMSEMHADDDYEREATVLSSLGLDRAALAGRYYRLPLMTAAGGRPALTVPEWRAWITGWLRDRGALLLIVDTATGATQVDPWGREIQAVYSALRVMLAEYPDLAIVLLLHLKKPQGRGERRLSDVLGEWGRWCDVVLLMENDGAGLTRARLTLRKRVRRERRIVATKAGGLLVDPVDLDETQGTKVPLDDVLAAIEAAPGIGLAALGARLGVSKDTAGRYVGMLEEAGSVVTMKPGPGRPMAVYPAEPTAAPPHTAAQARCGGPAAAPAADEAPPQEEPPQRRSTYIGAAVPAAAVPAVPPGPSTDGLRLSIAFPDVSGAPARPTDDADPDEAGPGDDDDLVDDAPASEPAAPEPPPAESLCTCGARLVPVPGRARGVCTSPRHGQPAPWRCPVGPAHEPATRTDGTSYCSICHPGAAP